MTVDRCPYCHVPLVRTGKRQIFPRLETRRWYSMALADCPRCETTRAVGEMEPLSAEEVRERQLPDLNGLPARDRGE